jgi:beta-lactamase class A
VWKRAGGLVLLVGGMLSFSVGFALSDAHATDRTGKAVASISPPPSQLANPAVDTPAPPMSDPTPVPVPIRPTFAPLAAAVDKIIAASGAQVGVSLIELGGSAPSTWQLAGTTQMDAASTYKLPALMEEAQLIAAGKVDAAGEVCFEESDWEDGWFDDYYSGACYSRNELADRAGHYSDNTAGHLLVRDLGGASELNSYASGLGAQSSTFFDGNLTTPDDLARLLAAEATGAAGGAKAQAWLYPYLTNSKFEAGIPAGLPAGTSVVHKTGDLDSEVNDVAIISGGKGGSYVLSVMTDGLGGDAAWSLVAKISAAIWSYEGAR